MKIEIEFEYVEGLKNDLRRSQQMCKELSDKIDALDEKKVKRQMLETAKQIADKVVQKAFEDLGFDKGEQGLNGRAIRFIDDYRIEDERYFEVDKVNFSLAAWVTPELKQAFLNIGIITPK